MLSVDDSDMDLVTKVLGKNITNDLKRLAFVVRLQVFYVLEQESRWLLFAMARSC